MEFQRQRGKIVRDVPQEYEVPWLSTRNEHGRANIGLLCRLKGSEYEWIRQLGNVGLLGIQAAEEAIDRIAVDRMHLAEELLKEAETLSEGSGVSLRTAISHAYYAQYHSARAVVFHLYRRDMDDHGALPRAIEKVFGKPFGDLLKYWREKRNKVDYSPYPQFELKVTAREGVESARRFLNICTDHLRKRGVSL